MSLAIICPEVPIVWEMHQQKNPKFSSSSWNNEVLIILINCLQPPTQVLHIEIMKYLAPILRQTLQNESLLILVICLKLAKGQL